MINYSDFRVWMKENTNYSDRAISNVLSRLKRANRILEWSNEETYLFLLDKNEEFCKLSNSVKSQLRRAVKFYSKYIESLDEIND